MRAEFSEDRPVYGLTDLRHYLKNMQGIKHEDEHIELDKKYSPKPWSLKPYKCATA